MLTVEPTLSVLLTITRPTKLMVLYFNYILLKKKINNNKFIKKNANLKFDKIVIVHYYTHSIYSLALQYINT